MALLECLVKCLFLGDLNETEQAAGILLVSWMFRMLYTIVYCISFLKSFFRTAPLCVAEAQHQEVVVLVLSMKETVERLERQLQEDNRRWEQRQDSLDQLLGEKPHRPAMLLPRGAMLPTGSFSYLCQQGPSCALPAVTPSPVHRDTTLSPLRVCHAEPMAPPISPLFYFDAENDMSVDDAEASLCSSANKKRSRLDEEAEFRGPPPKKPRSVPIKC